MMARLAVARSVKNREKNIFQETKMYAHLVQRSPEWFEARKQFALTCSEFAAAMGISPYTSRSKLLTSKLDPSSVKPHTKFTEKLLKMGEVCEPIARLDLESFLNVTIEEEGLHYNPDYLKIAGSHDGIIKNTNTIVEIKVKTTGILPSSPDPAHVVQCLGNLEMRQADNCLLVYWVECGEIRYWVIPRNTKLFNNLVWPYLREFINRLETKRQYPKMEAGVKQAIKDDIMRHVSLNISK